MATKERLEQALRNADKAGDVAAAKRFAAAIRNGEYDQSSVNPAQPVVEQPKQEIGTFDALGSGFKRGITQVGVGLTQKLLETAQYFNQGDVDEFEAALASGELKNTPDNQAKLAQLKKIVQDKQGAINLAQGFEQQQRDQFAPIQESNPVASMAGNVAGQIAAIPIPGIQAGLKAQMLKGAAEGAGIGYIQPTVEGESSNQNAAIGTAIGAGVPLALRPIVAGAGAAYRAVAGDATGDAANVARYADQNNLPFMTTDAIAPESWGARAAQSASEKVPFVGTGGMRANQQNARTDVMKDIAERYGVPNDREIIESLSRKSDKLSAAAGKRYDETVQAMGDTPIPLTRSIAAIDDQIQKYTQGGAVSNPKVVNALKTVRDQLTSGDNNLALLRQNRTTFRELFRDENGAAVPSAQKAIDAVYNGLTADMRTAVGSKLGPAALREMNQADAIWAREAGLAQNTKLKNIIAKGDIKPEIAQGMLFSKSPSETKILFNSLDTKGRDNARAAILNKIFESSRESPDVFLNKLTSPQYAAAVNQFFKGENKAALMGAVNYLKYTKQAAKAGANPVNGQQVMQIGVPAVGVGSYALGGLPALGAVASVGAAARIYESKAVRNALLRMSSIPPGSTKFEKAAAELESAINAVAPKTQGTEEQTQ